MGDHRFLLTVLAAQMSVAFGHLEYRAFAQLFLGTPNGYNLEVSLKSPRYESLAQLPATGICQHKPRCLTLSCIEKDMEKEETQASLFVSLFGEALGFCYLVLSPAAFSGIIIQVFNPHVKEAVRQIQFAFSRFCLHFLQAFPCLFF